MGFLALYDTSGIQKYIYDSNRLKDNRGGSILVEKCFTNQLVKAVEIVAKNPICNWDKQEVAAFLKNKEVECEVIYIGGGNAQLYFQTEELYKKTNTEFSKLLLEEIPGLTILSEIVNVDDCRTYGEVMDLLFKKLQLKKQKSQGMMSAPCMSVTRECAYTRGPAVKLGKDGRWISEEIIQKRKVKSESETEIYKETDQMAGKEGEQWIATVHIDGNDMGKHINEILKNVSYEEGIEKMRRFSKEIQKVYEDAYKNMCESCKKLMQQSEDDRLDIYRENPPFRKIYGAGDDLTFVCYAPLAIKATEIFMQDIAGQVIEGRRLSSCSGIAFSKPGYPFFKAYMIAEQCCKSAKMAARANQEENETLGSYVDFQMIRGSQSALSILRKNEYQKKEYDLLLRPYSIEQTRETNLKFFYQISEFIEDKKIARSKMKDIRNAYYVGKEKVGETLALIERRYHDELLELEQLVKNRNVGNKGLFIDNHDKAVLFDALEMMDLYIRL